MRNTEDIFMAAFHDELEKLANDDQQPSKLPRALKAIGAGGAGFGLGTGLGWAAGKGIEHAVGKPIHPSTRRNLLLGSGLLASGALMGHEVLRGSVRDYVDHPEKKAESVTADGKPMRGTVLVNYAPEMTKLKDLRRDQKQIARSDAIKSFGGMGLGGAAGALLGKKFLGDALVGAGAGALVGGATGAMLHDKKGKSRVTRGWQDAMISMQAKRLVGQSMQRGLDKKYDQQMSSWNAKQPKV